jgi:hypothetical protein
VNRIESAAVLEALSPLDLTLPLNPVTCDATYEVVVLARAVGLGQAARRAIAATAETVKWRGFDGGFTSFDTFGLAGRTDVSDMSSAELITLRTSI